MFNIKKKFHDIPKNAEGDLDMHVILFSLVNFIESKHSNVMFFPNKIINPLKNDFKTSSEIVNKT